MKLYVNGNIINEEQAVVSVYDHGFLYGMGLFETFRTYGGRPFLLERHLERLAAGCRELEIQHAPKSCEVNRIVQELLEANGLTDAYIRYTITGGTNILGLPTDEYKEPTTIVYMKPLPQPNEALYEKGKALQLLRLRRNTPEGPLRQKSLHYMNNILAKRELAGYPYAAGAEGLMLDAGGHIAEGIVSNVFYLQGERLCTPSTHTGILPGITRRFVLELAADLGLHPEEGFYRWEELRAADEIFITNSIQELVPITTLYDIQGESFTMSEGKTGPITRQLLGRYRSTAKGGV
jgi:4-amino-4-deoxychorismate lyase